MSDSERSRAAHAMEEFTGESTGEPTRDLSAWRWLWEGDHSFPIGSHRGLLGRLVVFFKRLARPWVKVPQNDLWERQRVFNLVLLSQLEDSPELDRMRWNAQELKDLSIFLTRFFRSGIDEIVEHNDALYSSVDQKLDRYRRESKHLWARLGSALALAEGGPGGPTQALAEAVDGTVELELESAIDAPGADRGGRLADYLDLGLLPPSGRVLELDCGLGEGVELLRRRGYDAAGTESRSTVAEAARQKGLPVDRLGPIEALGGRREGELAAVVGLGVAERLAPAGVVALARLAWRALEPGGSLLLECSNPLSLVAASDDFWLDPRRRRPVHPEGLAALLRSAGFESVRRYEGRPYAVDDRLPEIPLEGLEGQARVLADQVNRLRDRLDDLLYGARDYLVVGVKPAGRSGGSPG